MSSTSTKPSNALLRIYPALSIPTFRLTWAGMLPSQAAVNMGEVATPYAAFLLTGSATAIGVVSLIAGLPMMLFTLVGGVVADRLPRRAILMASQGTAFVATAILTWVVIGGHLEVWHLAAFGAVQSTLFAFNNPAYQAFIAELVPRPMVRSAVAVHMTGFNLARVAGPSVAGVVLAVPSIGLAGVYAGMSVMNALALSSLVRLRSYHSIAKISAPRPQRAAGSSWGQLTEGLSYVTSVPLLRGLLLMGLVPLLFGMPVQSLLPIFAERVHGSGPVGLGVLSASVGLGGLAGSVVGAGLAHHTRPVLIQRAIGAALGAALLGFALAPTMWLASPLAAVIGFCQLVYMVLNNGLIISSAEPRLHGRVTSVNMLRFSMTPVAILGATSLADRIGPQATVAIGGLVTLIAMAAFSLWAIEPRPLTDSGTA